MRREQRRNVTCRRQILNFLTSERIKAVYLQRSYYVIVHVSKRFRGASKESPAYQQRSRSDACLVQLLYYHTRVETASCRLLNCAKDSHSHRDVETSIKVK